jgi:hypothetical protein
MKAILINNRSKFLPAVSMKPAFLPNPFLPKLYAKFLEVNYPSLYELRIIDDLPISLFHWTIEASLLTIGKLFVKPTNSFYLP